MDNLTEEALRVALENVKYLRTRVFGHDSTSNDEIDGVLAKLDAQDTPKDEPPVLSTTEGPVLSTTEGPALEEAPGAKFVDEKALPKPRHEGR